MAKEKKAFGINVDTKIEKALRAQVKKGKYLKLSKSEVVEEMLWIVLENITDEEKFSERLRARIIKRRKEGDKLK